MTQWVKLTELQPYHLACDDDTILISASAGTGKSTALLNSIREYANSGVPLRNMMFLSFNAGIANEFKERAIASGFTISKEEMRYMATWHGIGKRLSQSQGVLKSGKVAKLADSGDSIGSFSREVLNDLLERMGADHSQIKYLKNLFQSISKKTVEGKLLSNAENTAYYHLLEYQKEKPCISFLSMLREMLTRPLFDSDVTHVFVDEAQDIGWGHSYYLRNIKDKHAFKLIMAGDEKQGINGFMGAESSAFVTFPADHKAIFTKTFRLPKSHLEYSNRIFSRSTSIVGLTQETGVKEDGVLEECGLHTALGKVSFNIEKGDEVMILARHTSTVDEIGEILRRSRIPYVTAKSKKNSGIEQIHFDFAREKEICIEKQVITSSMLDVLNPLRGTGEKGLLNIRKKKAAIYVDHSRRDQYKKEQRELESAQRTFLFNEMENFDVVEDILPSDTERLHRAGVTPKLVEDLLADNLDFSFFLGKKDVYDLVSHWVHTFGENMKPVTISTIHKAKGLEADVVLLCTATFGASEDAERNEPESERRVWYVGATRSRHALYLVSLPSQQTRTRLLPRI